MRRYFTILFFIIGPVVAAQSNKANEYIQRGNDHYRKQEYRKAIGEYQRALDMYPASMAAAYNKANATYQLDQKVEAAELFTRMLATADTKEMRDRIYYNKGVILSGQKNLEESIEAYKNALRNDPTDKDARENLQKALLELKKKNPPKKEENKNNKKQQQQQKQQQSKMDQQQTQQRLQLLQQKEKQVQERIQSEKNKGAAGSRSKDW